MWINRISELLLVVKLTVRLVYITWQKGLVRRWEERGSQGRPLPYGRINFDPNLEVSIAVSSDIMY